MSNIPKPQSFIRLPLEKTQITLILEIRAKAAKVIHTWYKSKKLRHNSNFSHLVTKLLKTRAEAASFIQKIFKGWSVRTDLKFLKGVDQKKLIRWTHSGNKVYLSSNFTENPWNDIIPMRYCKSLKEFIRVLKSLKELFKGV